MRLYEIAEANFNSDLVNMLKVMQGRAKDAGTSSLVTWDALNTMLMSNGYSTVNSDVFAQLADQLDPSGELIKSFDERGIVLNTDLQPEPEEDLPNPLQGGKTVDQMATSAAKKSL